MKTIISKIKANKRLVILITILIVLILVLGLVYIKKNTIPIKLEAEQISYIEINDFGIHDASVILHAITDKEKIIEITRFFNDSKKFRDDVGTTHPISVLIKVEDGSEINFWCGTQGFITVSNGNLQFNIQNNVLNKYVSEILNEHNDKLKTAFKGLELYIWQNPDITGNEDIYFTLLDGTNRNKDKSEIYNLDIATTNIDEINLVLEQYSNETEVIVLLVSQINQAQSGEEVQELEEMQQIMDAIEFPIDRKDNQSNDNNQTVKDECELEIIVANLLDEICSKPLLSSKAGDYIKENKKEYDELIGMGMEVLPCLVDILNDHDFGLRGNIVHIACNDIIIKVENDSETTVEIDLYVSHEVMIAINDWEEGIGYTRSYYKPMKEHSKEDIQKAKTVVEKYYNAMVEKDADAIFSLMYPRNGISKKEYDNGNISFFEKETTTLVKIHEYDIQNLLRRSYSEERPEIESENIIVFKVDFEVKLSKDDKNSCWSEGMYYDWSIILVRTDEYSPWLIFDQGY